ncbi:hypothetical protein QQ73_01550 [Candidatus Endoriftia persephone str. Guaymas]|nr:hypothetical protein [Candidatus Endoriftia persephone str. Guaymas]
MPKMADLQCHCDTGHLNLRQALPQRDSDLLGFERIDRSVLVSKDLADLRPVRGPPRDEILFSFSAPPGVPIPKRIRAVLADAKRSEGGERDAAG